MACFVLKCRRPRPDFWRLAALAVFFLFFPVTLPLAAPMVLPDNIPEKPGRFFSLFSAMLDDISNSRAQIVAIQKELISRPALNPEDGGDGEMEKALWIESWLHSRGIDGVVRLDMPDNKVAARMRPNLVVRYPEGGGFAGPTLWLVAQMDISPPGDIEDWPGTPYVLRVDGDHLHGAGAEDNNQGIATCLLLLDSVKRHSLTPQARLGVIFPAAGNRSQGHGLEYILAERPGLFGPDDRFIFLNGGAADGALIDVAEKRYLWQKVTVKGKAGVAARPYSAVNPVPAALELMESLSSLPRDFPYKDERFIHPQNFFTFVGVEENRSTANTIPGEFTFYMDIRLVPSCPPELVEAAIREKAAEVERDYKVRVYVKREGMGLEAKALRPDSEFVTDLARAVREQTGVQAKAVGRDDTTLANYLRHKDFQAVAWGMARRKDFVDTENASVAAHIDQAKVLLRLLYTARRPPDKKTGAALRPR